MRIICSSIDTHLADCIHNQAEIISRVKEARKHQADIILFPELSITGYSCGDLFFNSSLLNASLRSLKNICRFSQNEDIVIAAGLPLEFCGRIYNCAVLIFHGDILGIVPKSNLRRNGSYSEARHFSPSVLGEIKTFSLFGKNIPFGQPLVFHDSDSDARIAVEIGADLQSPVPVSSVLSLSGANIILNISAYHSTITSDEEIRLMSQNASFVQNTFYFYCSGGNESTTDHVFSSYKCAFCEGRLLGETGFYSSAKDLSIDIDPADINISRIKNSHNLPAFSKIPSVTVKFSGGKQNISRGEYSLIREPFMQGLPVNVICSRLLEMQKKALSKKLRYTNTRKTILGISGGIDSTVALLAVCECYRENSYSMRDILGVTMPGPGTTARTLNNANKLMASLGISSMTVDINASTSQHLSDIGQPENLFDEVYQQTQSRERTKILMNLSTKEKAVAVGTGDMSEFALGWMAYSGDHISMYAINSGIPKTVIRHMAEWFCSRASGSLKDVLTDIIATPVSPELLPLDEQGRQSQRTEKLLGAYILHDFFLYHMIVNGYSAEKIYDLACTAFAGTYSAEEIKHCMKIFAERFFTRQYKKNCFSDGAQYFVAGLSPRGYWQIPSDVYASQWLFETDSL